jgi:Asp-tRNA(Asn)/Glu-tRNA(Gln) amidotransferase A subunit family amidase
VQSHLYSDFTRGMADGFRRDRGRVVGASRRLRRTTQQMAAFFDRYDVMLSPVTSGVAPPIGHLANDVPHEELLSRVFAWIPFPPIANAAGTPAISLPLGWDEANHVPVGAMFGAATGQDALLLQLATEIEAARGGFATLAAGAPTGGRCRTGSRWSPAPEVASAGPRASPWRGRAATWPWSTCGSRRRSRPR